MDGRALVGLVGIAMLVAAAPAFGQTARTGTLSAAADLAPARGGAAPTPFSYHALHPQQLAQAKAGGNAKGGGGKPGGGGSTGGPTVTSYSNVSPSFNGINQSGLTPPDTTGAIGPDRYIETINTKYAIYTRSGGSINSGTLSQLTGISGGIFGYSLSDPQMMWDAKTQRFYYTAVYYDAFLSNMGLAVGWSKTGTPASSSDFCKYTIGFGAELPDYPKLGDSAGFLIYGYNLFGNGATTYDGSEVATLNKPGPGSTCPAASTSTFAVGFSDTLLNADSTMAATPVPANSVDDPATGYVVANADLTTTSGNSATFIDVYSVTPNGNNSNGVPVASVNATTPRSVSVPSYSIPANAVQQGSSFKLDTLDGRFEAAVASLDGGTTAIWTAHAVAPTAAGISEERWYELDPTSTTPRRSGTVAIDSTYVWNGAISPDRASNGSTGSFGDSFAMSFSTSSSASYPAIQFVSQRAGGVLSGPNPLVQSAGPNVDFSCSSTDPCRWGDYSGASPDPAATGAAGRVWLANQYNVAGGTTSGTAWRTWVFAVSP